MSRRLPTAPQELAFLRYIARHEPVTSSVVAEDLGARLGLSRSTVLTVMERLRRKGHLRRRRADGVYEYRSVLGFQPLMLAAVGHFVERSLGGSVLPIAAWLSDRAELSESEVEELRRIVARLEPKGGRS